MAHRKTPGHSRGGGETQSRTGGAHQARKRFGQHFLADESVVDAIVRAIDPQPGDAMVEIGPGLSALTAPLLDRLDRLTVVELDRDLARGLRDRWGEDRLRVIEADALTVDFGELAAAASDAEPGQGGTDASRLRVVGNLPYNISSPLLFHLLRWAGRIHDQHFMLQREVIDRMVARPGDSQYGRLSVMLQARYRMTHLFDVPPEAFDPPPRVMSAVVRMRPLAPDALRQPRDSRVFERLVARVFEQRRKMIRGSLGAWAEWLDWDALGVAPTARPQELTVAQFMDMADALSDAGVMPTA
ncbi:16S rRNA (adenine(1518)-N(6)/adenine(1519)-N(6))-dimethyltransferase RsmA [Castellaniella sp.]|jgi:16S rRNA (adenine1518-N6/adenine1519-N6)-dimethyltransferase|uniref:16S rRNA (adenine(1518)-N(6)/adenine(1519)-N(6))- dimethyltransferase RsmA n=1 Tax=Castellaniella sp. TaxID=1955812 RepID=UPI002D806A27|nr:16S rRNA (adenine(1518)-N(6)/adenine(1519)-N(6))-dimethyltransferase RsmA [Castellaniella sp.]HET8703739.1 16S rRNA (adenine(1518)-N(6)/adenine(1519)-N(6))-dimethyltransferase RsmA [Castellaniella sp.]